MLIMTLSEKLIQLAQSIGADIGDLMDTVTELSIGPPLSVIRSGEDANGLFTVITHQRPDATTHRVSTLSGGTSPQYTTRTIVYYELDGTTVKSTQVYTLNYNGSGVLVSEMLNP